MVRLFLKNMITLLAKKLIKNYQNYTDNGVRSAYGYLCAIVGIVLNLILFAGKFVAGTIAGSVAVTADAFHSLSDAASSVTGLIGFKLAAAKPNPKHPYGHGRIEYISSLLIAAILMVMGVELGKESIEKIIHPSNPTYSVMTFVILGISILVKLYMFLYNKSVAKKIKSSSMKAIAMDSISDTIATFAVLVSGIIAHFTGIQVDGYIGVMVALFILYAGVTSAIETVNELLGTPPEPEFVEEIENIVKSQKSILGIHDFIAHSYGPGNTYVSLHAEVPADGDILELHDMIDNAEFEIQQKLGCLATIHMDPVDIGPETLKVKEIVRTAITSIDESFLFHDFRMVAGPTHTNLIFDVVVPHGLKQTDVEIKRLISEKLKEADSKYICVITIDKDYAGHIK